MQIIRDPAQTSAVADLEMRQLIDTIITSLSQDYPYDPDELGYFVLVEPGDTITMLEAQMGLPLLANRWTGLRFDQPGYTQHFELLQEHPGCYELVLLVSDDGYGIELLIPKNPGVAPALLAMCAHFTSATPSTGL